jgi:hypothetical protein
VVSLGIMRRGSRAIVAAGLLLGSALGAGTVAAEEPRTDAAGEAARPAAPAAPPMSLGLNEAGRERDIPWDRLDTTAYDLVRDVVDGAALAREVRDITFRSRKPVFDYLLDNPDFAAEVARILREGKYRIRRVGEGYEADDGHGGRGTMRFLLNEEGRRVYYLQGRYDPPLLPTLTGRLVILLDTEHLDGPDGVTYCAMKFAGYLKLDGAMADAVARVMQMFSEDQVDKRVRRFFRHVAAVSRRAYNDPEGLVELLATQPQLPADQVAAFRELLLAQVLPGWAADLDYRFLDAPAATPE